VTVVTTAPRAARRGDRSLPLQLQL
jgi:hypothetical protein